MIDATDLVLAIDRGNVDPLLAQAIRSHRAKWIAAVKFLRRRNRWVLDGARVTWGVPGEAA